MKPVTSIPKDAITILYPQQLQFILRSESLKQNLTCQQSHLYHKLLQIYILLAETNFFLQDSATFKEIQRNLQNMIKNQTVFQYQCRQLIHKIANLFQYKTFRKQQITKVLCPKLAQLIQQIMLKFEVSNIYDLFDAYHQYNKSDSASQKEMYFLKQFRNINNLFINRHQYSFDQNTLLSIGQHKHSFPKSHFPEQNQYRSQLLNDSKNQNLAISRKQLKQSIGISDEQYNYSQAIDKFLNSIEKQRQLGIQTKHQELNYKRDMNCQQLEHIEAEENLPISACLGCTSFFFQHYPITHYSAKQQIPLVTFSTVTDLQRIQSELTAVICSLLNSGGGLILFEVGQLLMRQVAIGTRIDLQTKNVIINKIINLFRVAIYPAINIQKMIQVDFVPVVENPFTLNSNKLGGMNSKNAIGDEGEAKNHELQVLDGLYVTRIKIYPQQSGILYFIRNNSSLECYIQQQSTTRKLSPKQAHKMIKKKAKKYIKRKPAKFNQFGSLLTEMASYFGHKCEEPTKTTKQKNSCHLDKQQLYSQMFMIVAKEKDLPTIKKNYQTKGTGAQSKQGSSDRNSAQPNILPYYTLKHLIYKFYRRQRSIQNSTQKTNLCQQSACNTT